MAMMNDAAGAATDITAEEWTALPDWARRGLIPHHPVLNQDDEAVCDECDGLWGEHGCEVVVLTLHLAQSALALRALQQRADAAAHELMALRELLATEVLPRYAELFTAAGLGDPEDSVAVRLMLAAMKDGGAGAVLEALHAGTWMLDR